MEMIDVLQRLKEIQESRPGVVDDAVANLENLNPKTEGAVKAMLMDLEQDAAELSKEEFIKKHGSSHMDIWNRVQNEKEEFGENGEGDSELDRIKHLSGMQEDSQDYSKMTDKELIDTYNAVMANAYAGDAGAIEDEMQKRNLRENKKPIKEAKPDFLDMDKDGDKKEPMKKAIKDKEVVKEEDAYDNERFLIKNGKATRDVGNTPNKKDHVYAPDAKTALQLHKQGKKVYKEAIQITADTPQEASMMMRMLQMAGVKPLDQDMINQPAEQGCGCDSNSNSECDCNKADEAQDGGFASSTTAPDTKVQDTDTLVNFHSGGLNRQKGTHPKVAGGDNPMQRTESLSDSLKQQYAEFKANYLNAVNEQKKDK